METLSTFQYDLVYNFLSFTIAAMGAAFVFFIFARQEISPNYRGALLISALVVGIAGYHYLRMFESWKDAYTLINGVYVMNGTGFNDAYRYVDWLLTVPLLMVELVAVLALAKAKRTSMLFRLVIASALMIILGYPGEIASDVPTRLLWGTLSTIPFAYILYVLWVELGRTQENEPENVRVLLRNIRLLLLATWGFYPISYLFPIIGFTGGTALVAVQIGYSISDVLAKAFYGVMIYWIAKAKTENEKAPEGILVPAAAD